jgi:hypothetical protein
MHLGERCDEILRLIDETLVSVGTGDDDLGHPSGADLAGRRVRPPGALRPRRWSPSPGAAPTAGRGTDDDDG